MPTSRLKKFKTGYQWSRILVCLFGVLWAATTFFPGVCLALDPNKNLSEYGRDEWQDGLPQNSVNTIIQSKDGYLWLGTYEGLVRFDGVQFTVFDKRNTPEIKSNGIWTLLEDHTGALWVGTLGGGLIRWAEGKWTVFTTDQGLLSNSINALSEDRQGTLWIGTTRGLNCLRRGTFSSFTRKEGLTNEFVRTVFADSHNSIWVGTNGGGVDCFQAGVFTNYSTQNGLSNNNIYAIQEDLEGAIWVGTDGGGVNRFKDRAWKTFTIREGLADNLIRSLYRDSVGTLWIGTGNHGINCYRNGKFFTYSRNDGLALDLVRSICEDHEGSLWIGTNSGLKRLKDSKFITYGAGNRMASDSAKTIYQDQHGTVWIGNDGSGIYCLKDGLMTFVTAREGLPSNTIRSITGDVQGTLWIGTYGVGLSRLKDGKFTNFTVREGLSNNVVNALYFDRQGTLWIGTLGGGLNCYKDGKFSTYTTKDGLSDNTIRAIIEDRAGRLWIGTANGGLNCFQNGKFTFFRNHQELANDNIFSIYEDQNGTLWIGTGEGLNRFRDGQFTNFTTASGLFEGNIFQILEDGNGYFWMSCNKGIFRVRKQDLEDFAAGRITVVTSISYGKGDGMESSQCNGASQPAGCVTRDGRLWFPTIKGVVVIDPNHIPLNEHLPPVSIEKVLVDNDPVDTHTRQEIPSSADNFEFHYTGLSFLAPEKVRFKYQLEGFDRDWVDAGTRRVAYYTNLVPGSYTFRVKACNNDGLWNEAGASMGFYLKPSFWKSWWAYLFYVATIAGVIYSVVWLRLQALQRLNNMLEEKIQKRTVELAGTVEQLRASEKQALESEQKALEANRAKSMFLANMSHEIRTPMNGVIGMTGILLDTPLTTDQREYAETVKHSAQSLLTVINDILDFSKIEAGKLEIEMVEFDLRQLIKEVVDLFSPKVQAKGLSLNCLIGPEIPKNLWGDPVRLRQVLVNLVGNAEKFTHQGQVVVTVERVVDEPGGDGAGQLSHQDSTLVSAFLRFEVLDTGIGISQETIPLLFQSFSQADGSMSRKYGGTGLGLAISKQLIEMMGGQIQVETEVGKGSKFWFVVGLKYSPPLEIDPATIPPRAEVVDQKWVAAQVLDPSEDGDANLILIVEDNAINQRVAKRQLEKLGYRSDVASNGHEALDAFSKIHYSLILMDCQMPEMDGFGATEEIRRREGTARHVPIIALTANTIQGDQEKCLAAGMDDFIAKPVKIEELEAALQRWLGKSSPGPPP